jgi:hypothetical protein
MHVKLITVLSQIRRCAQWPSIAFVRAKNHSQWRKENREDLFVSRIAIRSGLIFVLVVSLVAMAVPRTSGAYTATWQQTNWNGGVGSSTSDQYSSATGINDSTSGEFELDNLERALNTSFDTNLDNWTTGNSEITPSVVETTTKIATNATSHSLALRTTPQVGNMLVAAITWRSNPGTIGAPSGWTEAVVNTNPSSLARDAIYYKVYESGDPTTITFTNSVTAITNFTIQEITGVDPTNPVDVTSSANSGAASTTTVAIPDTAETTRANAIAIARVGYENTSAITSWSNGFVNADATTTYGYTGTKVLTSKQQVSTTFTGVTARRNNGVLAVFKGALASQQNNVLPGVVQSRAYTTELVHTMALDSEPQVGNMLVVAITTTGNPGSIILPSGWTQAVGTNNTSSLGRAEIYYKVVEEGEPRSLAVESSSGTVTTFSLHELSGIDTSDPVDVTSVVNSGTTLATTVAIPDTATTTSANAFAIARVGYDNTSAYSSWTNSFTNLNSITNYGYTATKVLSSTQTVSTTFTGVTARRNHGALAVFKSAALETPAQVQVANYRYSLSPAITARYTTPVSKGNTLFVAFNTRANVGTITPPPGWVQVASAESASGRGTYLYSKVADENDSVNFRFDSQYTLSGSISVFEVRGILESTIPDELTTFANVSLNPLTFSIPTTTSDSAFILGAMGSSSTSGFPISWAANGFTTILGSATSEFQSGHKFQETAAAYNLSFTNASARIMQGFLAAFEAGRTYTNATRTTGTKYSGAASAKVEASPWADTRYTQTVNTGDTETYELSAYVYDDGEVVDENIAKLLVDNQVITTDYAAVGGDWYKLSADITGVNGDIDYGLEVYRDNTVYVDDFSISRRESTGTLTSNIYDTGRLSNWADLNYVSSGTGNVEVKVRSSNNDDMTGAPNFSTCAAITSGDDISAGTNGCVTDAERYIQYQVILTASGNSSPVFEDITIDYRGADETAPDDNASNIQMYTSDGGDAVALNGWTNGNTPYFSWTDGIDNAGGIGVAGYCVYLGTDDTADPVTTKGMLGTGDLNVRDSCPFATSETFLDLSEPGVLATQLTTATAPYYLNIKAIDGNDNIFSGASESFHFRFDNTAPTNPAFINAPSNFIATKEATLSWPTSTGSAPADGTSGVAGLQYRIGATGTWYGDDHTGSEAFDDLLDNDGEYTTQSNPDYDDLIEGSNVIYFRTFDNAGNVSVATVTTVLKVNTAGAPSSPQNIVATPSVNTQNSFAFSWLAPATYVGNVNNLTYCYTVNTLPNASNCTYTAAGVTSIPAGAYATQPGINTLYIVARDESSSINYATAAPVEFTANTAAPGIPLNPDIADTSVRASENWRLVISWEQPDDVGAGVEKYEVYRSTDGTNWTRAGNTSGSSYVDTSLDQQEYFYKIRACDSANNCGAFGSVVDATPTGRFTTPPLLTNAGGVPRVSELQTRSVQINWSTDRDSDSKVAFGTKSGQYGSTEAYNSEQTTDHEISIDNLTPGTTYYFVVKWTDTDGNTGVSSEQVFVTLPPPTVEDVNAVGIGLNNATIQYTTTGAAAVKLYYGQTNGFGAVVEAQTSLSRSTYLTALEDLQDGTKYFYKINTIDASGFEYDGTTISFDTPPAPKILNLRFQPVEGEPSSTQLISWETNVPATTELSYGVVGGETETSLDTTLTTTHEVKISQLVDDSTYRLIARSRDAKANLAVSDEQQFKTALDTRPPKVYEVTVVSNIRGTGADARGQIIVSWKTDEPATSQVAYGEGNSGDLGNSSTEDSRLTLDHAVVISDLSTSKVYSVQAISRDKGDNEALGDRQSAIIGRGTESALGIIFSVLQKIFGVGL